MVKYLLATKQHFAELRKLWGICFQSDEHFLDLFFNHGIILTSTYILLDCSEIASALSIFPIEYQNHRGGYIYGVCTHPKHRGKEYARKLLNYAEAEYSKTGADFFITRPASASLFNYYKMSGYMTHIRRSINTISLKEVFAPVDFKLAFPEDIYYQRMEYLGRNYFKWSIEELLYIIEYARYCKGDAIMTEEGYLIGYPNDKRYYVLESNLQEEKLCIIIKSLHNKCTSLEYYQKPFKDNKSSYMLFKSNSFTLKQSPVFSFTME